MERLKTLMIAALLAALAGSIALAATGGEAEVRINARQLEDGRVEFALQQRVDGGWGERQLPRSRYFPANAGHNRWLNSTPMTVSVASIEDDSDNLDGEPTATTPSGDPGKWRSILHDADWSGRRDVELILSADSPQGWQIRLDCTNSRRGVSVWKYERFAFDYDSGSSSVAWKFDGSSTVHRTPPLIEGGGWFFSEPSWDSRWYYPDGVLADKGNWWATLAGKRSVEIQFGAGRWAETVSFDLRGLANAEAWPTIQNCGS